MLPDEEHLFIALYTDADVNGKLAAKLREQGFDTLSTVEAHNTELSDEQQLEFATFHNRAILSHNSKDFEPLHRKWFHEGKHHAGIIISQRLGIGELLRRTLRLLNQVAADEMQNSCRHLGEFADHK